MAEFSGGTAVPTLPGMPEETHARTAPPAFSAKEGPKGHNPKRSRKEEEHGTQRPAAHDVRPQPPPGRKAAHGRQRLAAAAATALAACSLPAADREGRPADVAVVVLDVSGSTDAAARCAELSARLRPIVRGRAHRVDALALATGGAATGQPRTLVGWTSYAAPSGFFEGGGDATGAQEAWLSRMRESCASAVRGEGASPVFEAVEAAAAAVASRCGSLAGQGFACSRRVVAVHSDLRSSFGPFGRYLKAHAKAKGAALPPATPDLRGVELQLCGTANTNARGAAPPALLEAWGKALGRGLSADPTCERDPEAP